MDYVFKMDEWTFDGTFDFWSNVPNDFPSSSISSPTTTSTLDSTPDSILDSLMEFIDSPDFSSGPFLDPLPDFTPTPTTISTPIPGRIPHSRGRRAQRDESPQRRHRCPFPGCSDSFTRPEHLRRHLRAHKGEKPFHCGDCGKPFTRADNLKTHRRKMHGGPVREL